MNINFSPMRKLSLSSGLKAGFTLVEVLIVILIIALLMAFIIPSVLRGPQAARDATRIAHLNQIAVALESFRSAKRSYPTEGCIEAPTGVVTGAYNSSDSATNSLIKLGFLTSDKFPADPDSKNTTGSCVGGYLYKLTNNGAGFVLFSKLESTGRSTASDADLTVTTLPHDFTEGGGYYHVTSGL